MSFKEAMQILSSRKNHNKLFKTYGLKKVIKALSVVLEAEEKNHDPCWDLFSARF